MFVKPQCHYSSYIHWHPHTSWGCWISRATANKILVHWSEPHKCTGLLEIILLQVRKKGNSLNYVKDLSNYPSFCPFWDFDPCLASIQARPLFFRVCAFLLDSAFVTNLGLNKNHFCLPKVPAMTALLPKSCSCCSLCAKLLTATGEKKAQICKSQLFEILYILFLITLLHCCQFLPVFTIFFFPSKCDFQGTYPTGKCGKLNTLSKD